MIASICHVDVATPVNCNPIRDRQLFLAADLVFHSAEKRAGRREFLDAPVTGVNHQNISLAINCNPYRRIKLPLACALATLKHVSYIPRQGGQLGSSRERPYAILKLTNVLVRDVQNIKASYSPTKGKRNRVLRSEIAKRLKHVDYSLCLWIRFPDQLYRLVSGNITEDGPFICVPHVLFCHYKKERETVTKRQALGVVVIMQEQMDD